MKKRKKEGTEKTKEKKSKKKVPLEKEKTDISHEVIKTYFAKVCE